MRKLILLNLLALLLLPHGLAAGQKPAPPPEAAKLPAGYNLTELQKARMDAVRQEIFRWQDKMNEALGRFSALCSEAIKENNWPAVQCSLTDLTVTPAPAPMPPLKPAEK